MNTTEPTQITPEWARRIVSGILLKAGIFLQEHMRLANGHELTPFDGLSINDFAPIVIQHVPNPGIKPPSLGGTLGLRDIPEDENSGLVVTKDSVMACLADHKPRRVSDVAKILGVDRDLIEAIVQTEKSGLVKQSGGWLKATA